MPTPIIDPTITPTAERNPTAMKKKLRVKPQTIADLNRILADDGMEVVGILPSGEVRVLRADNTVDNKAYNAGIEAAIRWHKMRSRVLTKNGTRLGKRDVIVHNASAVLLKGLKR